MAPKDHGGAKAQGNPPKTGRAGKSPGSSKTNDRSGGTRPWGTNPPSGPLHAGPSNKGGKPPRT